MVAQIFMMLLMVLSGLRIKSLLEPEKFDSLRVLWTMVMGLVVLHICNLHSGNGILNTELFGEDYKNKFQTHSLSGVGAHHQNALAEW